jgi:hypothetical protein
MVGTPSYVRTRAPAAPTADTRASHPLCPPPSPRWYSAVAPLLSKACVSLSLSLSLSPPPPSLSLSFSTCPVCRAARPRGAPRGAILFRRRRVERRLHPLRVTPRRAPRVPRPQTERASNNAALPSLRTPEHERASK